MGPQEEKIVTEADSATSPMASGNSVVVPPDDKKEEIKTAISVDTALRDDGQDDSGDGKSTDDVMAVEKKGNSTEDENWFELLKTPNEVAVCSPSLQLVKGSNHLHGIGLKLATERSKKIDMFSRRLAQFVLDVSSHYETYGRSVLQTAQLIQPSENFAFPAPNDDKPEQFWDAINAYGMTFRRTAGFYKSKLYKPFVGTLQNDRQTINASNQRYIEIRNDCYGKRVLCIKAREMYIQAIEDAEKAVILWVVAKKNGPESTENIDAVEGQKISEGQNENNDGKNAWECTLNRVGSNIPTATKRLINYLKNVQNCERRYAELVEEENKAVARAQQVELEALRSFQEVELARIKSLLSDVAKPLCDIKSHSVQRVQLTPHNNIVTTSNSMDDEFNALAAEIEKKGKDLLANLFSKQQQNIPYEQGMGLMDAETLGLSQELGELRDKIKSSIAVGENASKSFQILGKFLEEISLATALLGKGLKQAKRTMAGNTSSPSKGSSVTESSQPTVMNEVGSQVGLLMKEIVEFFDEEAKLYLRLAEFFQSELNGKLETRLHPAAAAGNEYRLESETDDRNWKKLCDAARTEARAESNFKKTQQQQEKARERIHSTGDTGSTEGRDSISSTEDNPLTRKGLFGGEGMKLQDFGTGKAMKKLQESGRQFLAQKNLNEADQRINKEKQVYEAAIAAKSKGSTEYKVVTEVRLEKLEKMNEDGWTEISALLGSILSQIETLQQSRESVPENPLSLDDNTYDGLVKEARDWVESTRKSIHERIDVDKNKKPSPVEGFQLKVILDDAEGIYQILSLKGTEDRVAALEIDVPDDETIAQLDIAAAESSQAVEGAKRVLPKSASSPIEQDDNQDDKTRSIHSTQVSPMRDTTKEEQSKADEMPDLLAFAKEFGFSKPGSEGFPEILGSMNCTYRSKEKASFLAPTLHGRLYTTADSLYFRAWDGKNFVLSWRNIASIQKGKGLMGSSDRSIDVTYNDNDTQSAFILGRLEAPESTLVHLSDLLQKSKSKNVEPQGKVEITELKPVPPDEVMKKMEVVLTRTIRSTSIQNYYEQVWSEDTSFYRNWLNEEGCFECEVADWKKAVDSKGFLDPWSQERFQQQRLCTFKFKRTSHLYIGPPIAFVKQLQHCRVEGNDKCVLSISASFEGIPYSDCFVVEMRWVARRKGSNDILIEVGLFVDFKKSTMLKSQIKAGTISETKNVHQRLFEAASKACKAPGDVGGEDSLEVDEGIKAKEQNTGKEAVAAGTDVFWEMLSNLSTDNKYVFVGAAVLFLPIAWRFLSFLFGGGQRTPGLHSDDIALLNDRIDGLQAEVKALREVIESLTSLIKEAQ